MRGQSYLLISICLWVTSSALYLASLWFQKFETQTQRSQSGQHDSKSLLLPAAGHPVFPRKKVLRSNYITPPLRPTASQPLIPVPEVTSQQQLGHGELGPPSKEGVQGDIQFVEQEKSNSASSVNFNVHTFYYAWYNSPKFDVAAGWQHWVNKSWQIILLDYDFES